MTLDKLIELFDNVIPPQQSAMSACTEKVSGAVAFFLDEDDGTNSGASYCPAIPSGADPSLYFRLDNPSCSEIAVWKYDGCFYARRGPTRCDLILFSEEKIAFAELKLKMTSIKDRALKENRKQAIKQLEASILRIKSEFDAAGTHWPFSETFAYIALPRQFPYFASKFAGVIKRFSDDYQVTLQEANPITFP